MHIMVDLETFGSRPGSVIASVGAVAFDPVKGLLGAQFYQVVDARSAQRVGLTLDADTVLWWLKQGAEARAALAGSARMLSEVLAAFSCWWDGERGELFWSHGANFDEPMLAAAYRACDLKVPWKYSASRCTRTIFDLAGVQPDRSVGDHHNALDDAIAQASAVIEAYRALGLTAVEPA